MTNRQDGRRLSMGLVALAALALGGCVVHETKPIAKVEARQAKQQIPAAELLDIGVREFDPNIPAAIADDEEALDKKRIYPDIRKAESRLLAVRLRSTLEASGQWGAVRVVPQGIEHLDLIVSARIVESTGARLELRVDAVDATGRAWIKDRSYAGDADLGSYKTDAALRARDPFQNVHSQIANDLVAARDALAAAQRREIRQVAELRFAQDLDPRRFQGYLQRDAGGLLRIARLPAADDPALARIAKIRERDAAVIDTVDGFSGDFSEQLFEPYGGWRRTSRDAIEKAERTRNQALTRTALGAAAVLASIFVPSNCAGGDYNCQRVDSALRTTASMGGVAAVLSGIQKYADAKAAAQEVKELADSFGSEAAGQTVEVEGRTLKLTGTAEEQYREWRRLLAAIYQEENGVPAATPAGTAPAP
ncbi:MAG: hypothetical protein ACK51K_01705 [Gammaproteobacteria bacterium]